MRQKTKYGLSFLVFVVAITLMLLVGQSLVNAAVLLSDNFEDGNRNGWSTSGGSWSVVTDGSLVCKQSSISASAYSYTGTSTWRDYSVQARVKALSFNGTARSFGITARYQSTSNYYYLTLSNSNQLQLGKKASSGSAVLALKAFTVQIGNWYTLKLSVSGNQLQGYVDGVLQLSATDSALSAGKNGFIALYTSAEFDDVVVDGTIPATSTPTRGNTPTPSMATTPTPTQRISTSTPTPTRIRTATPTPTRIVTNTPTSRPSSTATPTMGPTPTTPPGQPNFNPIGFCNNGSTITGGAAGPTVYVSSEAQLEQYSDVDAPYTIYITSSFALSGMETHIRSNKTVIGVGNVTLSGGGLYLYRASNVIIRNLTITGSTEDNIGIHYSDHIWIDHCTFSNSTDGNVDITQASDYITISWCKFFYTINNGRNFVNLIAASDSDNGSQYHVTFHHNWWGEGCIERMPSVRFGRAHIYNNYYNAPGNSYCVRTRIDAECRVENNYFENVRNPWELYVTGSGTPGKLYAAGNNVSYQQTAYGVTWGSGSTGSDGSVVMIPGTDSVFAAPYSYTLDNFLNVKGIVMNWAGAGKI
jgi:pectate lyase